MPATESTLPIVEFNDIDLESAAIRVKEMALTPCFEIVITPNIDHLSRLTNKQNPELHSIYKSAALTLCDSKIVQKLMRFKVKIIHNVIPGSTLTDYLFRSGSVDNKNVCIIGAESEDIQQLSEDFPNVSISHINPSMGFINKPEEVADIIDKVCRLRPDFVFLAVGSPRQEVLAAKIQQQYHHGVGLCIGASILFLVGKEKRAPQLFQTLHLEWLYRALQRPQTLIKRYAKNFLALPAIYSEL